MAEKKSEAPIRVRLLHGRRLPNRDGELLHFARGSVVELEARTARGFIGGGLAVEAPRGARLSEGETPGPKNPEPETEPEAGDQGAAGKGSGGKGNGRK